MEIVIVTLLVCMILGISYILFGIQEKIKCEEELKKNQFICDFYQQEINSIEKLELVGIGNDENSDYKFNQAVKKVKLSDDVRVRLYD